MGNMRVVDRRDDLDFSLSIATDGHKWMVRYGAEVFETEYWTNAAQRYWGMLLHALTLKGAMRHVERDRPIDRAPRVSGAETDHEKGRD